jgi:predicted O-methyltransferase YrrM
MQGNLTEEQKIKAKKIWSPSNYEKISQHTDKISPDWLMTMAERFALIGLLDVLKPKEVLELGVRFGGATEHLSRFSKQVTSVDLDAQVLDVAKRYNNVVALCMNTGKALDGFIASGKRFDLCIVDADHSYHGAKSDLEKAIKVADVIICHDSMNPECSRGYQDALNQCKGEYIYSKMDAVLNEGIWGGFLLVLTRR